MIEMVAQPPAAMHSPAVLPRSANLSWITLLGLAGFVAAATIAAPLGLSAVSATAFVLVVTAAPMVIADIAVAKVHRRATAGLDWSRGPRFSPGRAAVKLLGLSGTYGVLALAYWLFPEYRNPVYASFFELLAAWWPYLVGATIVYVAVVDAYMLEPEDGHWQAGCLMLGRLERVDRRTMVQYCLGWLIKGFFIPLNVESIVPGLTELYGSPFVAGTSSFGNFYDFAFNLVYLIDVVFAAIGISLTLRLTDSHIQSTDATWAGWVACLVCYIPFANLFMSHYHPYQQHAIGWGPMLRPHPVLYLAWGSAILACLFIYGWASVTFGYRFSNLTHRGILTNGPYRLTKHPQYLFKNISWWLIWMPFASSGGPTEAIRGCLMLAAVNAVYLARAKTEERHLSRDPAYVAYAVWINEHGLLRRLGRFMPSICYRAPTQPTDAEMPASS
jgi:protein-S-isoprenylcysteine O-methyltransferase Ste14